MKILEHGNTAENKEHGEKFSCDKCGCVFRAKSDEYYVDYWRQSSITVSSLTYLATVTDTYACSCPECHKMVTKTKQRKTYTYEPWTINGSSTTLNVLDSNTVTTTNAEVKGE